ncbi:MAG: hypothetical protein KF736_02155 [Acidobacteria bacterium]|nr:hypothetical protein [Acidobacteriota bacterium]MCW5949211.1 hypothetical protein [Pyrinomonadaceae bacterium]
MISIVFRSLAIAAALAIGVLCLCVAGSSSAAAPKSANGQGTLIRLDESGSPVRRHFSFSGRQLNGYNADGNAILHNPEYRTNNGKVYALQIDIKCMKVVGNTAIFGGLTRRTNDPDLVDAAFFTVQDNGEPGKDRDKISLVYFFDADPTTTGDPMLCQYIAPSDFPLETIESGNVQVK